MKIAITSPITGKTTRHRARLTTEHAASSYGQPVLLLDGNPCDHASAIMQGLRVIEPPKQRAQVALWRQWAGAARPEYL